MMLKQPHAAFILMFACWVAHAECIDNSRNLTIDQWEAYGIRVNTSYKRNISADHIDVLLQPEICVKTDEPQCSLATYTVDAVMLLTGKKPKPVLLEKPNKYEYRASVAATAKSDSRLEITYRGEPCGKGRFRHQVFLIELKDLLKAASGGQ